MNKLINRKEIQATLFNMWSNLGMDIPSNYENIVQDCFEDVWETADHFNWNDSDVTIAFRRWIEKQVNVEQPMSEPTGMVNALNHKIKIGDKLNTVGELRAIIQDLDDNDQICIETIDLETGDTQDLYPMYVDVIENVQLIDGIKVREVRFCQMPNSEPDTRDKQSLVDMVIEQLKEDDDDCTVLDELLKQLPWEILKHSLPEDKWKLIDNIHLAKVSIWSEIRNGFEEEDIVHIDAWLTDNGNEGGKVIAKVNVRTQEVEYLDDRARIDSYAQEMISKFFCRTDEELLDKLY
jgi:hypothetical protein